jgi:RNA polymerase sigma-70 factor, ECF subfamily
MEAGGPLERATGGRAPAPARDAGSENNDMWAEYSRQGESRLLERIASGDRDAFGDLYDLYSKPLFAFAFRVLGNAPDAEDVLQEVFVQIWEKAGQFKEAEGRPFSWAVAMTRNKAIDRLRSHQRRNRLVEEATEAAAAEPVSTTPAPGVGLGADETTRLRSAVNTLPDDQRRAIEMAFFGGMTHHEIADKLSEPLGTIKARIRRGMLRLRDALEGTV